jgi:hypothetical protein
VQADKAAASQASSGMLQVQNGKLNGIPIWVWILIGVLAVSIALIVTGDGGPALL